MDNTHRYKLLTRDMGPYTRCAGTDVPPPQDFQLPLADVPTELPSYSQAKRAIRRVLQEDPSKGAMFVTLAYQCASTFRSTDYVGGCNGARIRLSPQIDWPSNAGLDTVITLILTQNHTKSQTHAMDSSSSSAELLYVKRAGKEGVKFFAQATAGIVLCCHPSSA